MSHGVNSLRFGAAQIAEHAKSRGRRHFARAVCVFFGIGSLVIGCGDTTSSPSVDQRVPVSVPDSVVPTVVEAGSTWVFHLQIPSTFVNVGNAPVYVHNFCDETIQPGETLRPFVFLVRSGADTTPIGYQRSLVCDLALHSAPISVAVLPGDSLSMTLEFSVNLSHPLSAADSAALRGAMQLRYAITSAPAALSPGMPQIPDSLRTSPVFRVALH